MTKKQLIKWLEGKQADAKGEVERQFTTAVTAYTSQRDKTICFDEMVDKVYEQISKIDDLISEWKEGLNKFPGIEKTDGYYGSCARQIHCLCDKQDIRSRLYKDFHDDGEALKALHTKRSTTIREIDKNYLNVISNVQNMKNAKAAVEYLTELGFDLSALIEADNHPVTTALSVEVDTKYLFVGGKNSDNQ